MKLGVLNCDRRLLEWLPKSYDLVYLDKKEKGKVPAIDALLIDWIPRNVVNKDRLEQQATVVDIYANSKNKPTIVLYDKYLDITEREFSYLKKFNTHFFEPAVNYRDGFDFLPPWTEKRDLMTIPSYDNDRPVDLGHMGSLKNRLGSFETYYVDFSGLYPKYNVHYTTSLPKAKIDEYKDAEVTKKGFTYLDMKCFMLIDTPRNYEIGYLNPNVFQAMYRGCFPLIPKEHRFYHSVFTAIDDIKYLSVYIEAYNQVQEIVLLDIYNNIMSVFPEMYVKNTIDVLRKCIEK